MIISLTIENNRNLSQQFLLFKLQKQYRRKIQQAINKQKNITLHYSMLKSPKVKKLIDENGIEVENFTMVIRLKKIIEELNVKISHQDEIIMSLKRDTKTTKINQMEVQIQHLNDQNKRLTLLIEELKNKYKKEISNITNQAVDHNGKNQCQQFIRTVDKANTKPKKKKKSVNKKDFTGINSTLALNSYFNFTSSALSSSLGLKKTYPQFQKQKQQHLKQQHKQRKFQKKYYDLLQQTQKLKKQLINIKLSQQSLLLKKIKSSIGSQPPTTYLQKNMEQLNKLQQQKHDLQAENEMYQRRFYQNDRKLKEYVRDNEEMKKVIDELKTEIKCKNLLNSETNVGKSLVFKDCTNSAAQNSNHCNLASLEKHHFHHPKDDIIIE